MRVTTIDPISDPRWDPFVQAHPLGCFYHLGDWAGILRDSFEYKPAYQAIEDDSGRIFAALPLMLISSRLTGRRLVSLPRTPYCDPLVGNIEQLGLLVEAAKGQVKAEKLQLLELKPCSTLDLVASVGGLQPYLTFKRHRICVNPPENELWKQLGRTAVRPCIKKAMASGIVVRSGGTEPDLGSFYRLHRQTAAWHRIPYRPYHFFRNIFLRLHGDGRRVLLVAERASEVLAAGLGFVYKNTFHFEFGGVDYRQRNQHAWHLLIWEAIRMTRQLGLDWFDFGVSSVSNPGLIDFKRRWGTQEADLYSFYFPDAAGYKKLAVGPERSGTLRSLRERVQSAVASRLYRHFG